MAQIIHYSASIPGTGMPLIGVNDVEFTPGVINPNIYNVNTTNALNGTVTFVFWCYQ